MRYELVSGKLKECMSFKTMECIGHETLTPRQIMMKLGLGYSSDYVVAARKRRHG